MPEGPEIRIAADRIAAAVAGRAATQIYFAFDHLKPYEEELRGQRIAAVEPRGKALLIHFEGGLSIYSHNQLYGRWFVRRAGARPRTGRSLRLALENEEKCALLYSASEIAVLDQAGIESHSFLSKIGPDVLDSQLRPAAIVRRLQSKRFRNRNLGALLLDQTFVAGLGNYLRSEILFVAGVAPEARPRDLDHDACGRVARAIRLLARRAYETRGVTLETKLRSRARDRARRPDTRHYVFARAGKPCRRCGEPIEKIASAGRRLYLCPGCQS
jgi:endonuclease-8